MTTAAQRAAAGAEYLDRTEPGWWTRIDISLLNMWSGCNCIGGQLDGTFDYFYTQMVVSHGLGYAQTVQWFLADNALDNRRLASAWRAEIHKRRAQEPSRAEA